MVKEDFVVGAFCEKLGRDGELIPLIRPCVDCGLLTGNWCEASCFAENWLGSKLEDWQDSQITPHCTFCEKNYQFCHFCLEKTGQHQTLTVLSTRSVYLLKILIQTIWMMVC